MPEPDAPPPTVPDGLTSPMTQEDLKLFLRPIPKLEMYDFPAVQSAP